MGWAGRVGVQAAERLARVSNPSTGHSCSAINKFLIAVGGAGEEAAAENAAWPADITVGAGARSGVEGLAVGQALSSAPDARGGSRVVVVGACSVAGIRCR